MKDLMIDFRVAELMASRLCHDLISPIGAVNNGIELLEEEGDEDLAADALRLADKAASQASVVVQFYRIAFGRGAGGLPESELRRIAETFLDHHKCTLSWPAERLPREDGGDIDKMLLNLLALGAETLPRGGTLGMSVTHPGGQTGGLPRIELTARGRNAGLRPEVLAAMTPEAPVAELTPRSVQAYVTARLAQANAAKVVAVPLGEGRMTLVLAPLEG